MAVIIKLLEKRLMFRSAVFITASVHGDKDLYKLDNKEKVSLFRVILLILHTINLIQTLKNILHSLISITSKCNIFSLYNISCLKLKQ